jgi:hypothetical protein
MVPDARVFSSMKNEQKYPWLIVYRYTIKSNHIISYTRTPFVCAGRRTTDATNQQTTKKYSPLKPLGHLRPNFGGMVRGWSPSKIVSDSPDLQPTWSLLLKIKKGRCSVFSNSGHVGWMSGLPDTILKGGHQRTKQSLVPIDPVFSEMKIFWISSPLFYF